MIFSVIEAATQCVDPELFSLVPDPDPTFQVVLDPTQVLLSGIYSNELCRIHPL
jgi:hypothetical protein